MIHYIYTILYLVFEQTFWGLEEDILLTMASDAAKAERRQTGRPASALRLPCFGFWDLRKQRIFCEHE